MTMSSTKKLGQNKFQPPTLESKKVDCKKVDFQMTGGKQDKEAVIEIGSKVGYELDKTDDEPVIEIDLKVLAKKQIDLDADHELDKKLYEEDLKSTQADKLQLEEETKSEEIEADLELARKMQELQKLQEMQAEVDAQLEKKKADSKRE